MLDDHEIVDNFGSAPEHASPRWQALRRGALDAFYDYQGSRAAELAAERPASLHFSWRYGPAAVFVMDLRSQKQAVNGEIRIYDDAQLAALARFLRENADAPVALLGLTVPLVYLPDWLAGAGSAVMGEQSDAADRWTHPKAERSRNRLVALLQKHQLRHPAQRLILLSGDIHCGLASEVTWLSTGNRLWQLISSAVANVEGPLYRSMATALPRISMGKTVDGGFGWRARLLDGSDGAHENPYAGLNVGIVKFERSISGWTVCYLLVSHDSSDPPSARVVFCANL
jgi:alkaline phosphatase D